MTIAILPSLLMSLESKNGDENKVRGHYIVEQAATDSFTDILEGVAPMPSTP